MTKNLTQVDLSSKRFWRDTWRMTKEAVVLGLAVAMLFILEAFNWTYAFETASARHPIPTPWGTFPREALLMSAFTLVCAGLALVAARRVGSLRDDIRKEVRARAARAAWVARGFLAIVVWFAACAFTYEQRVRAWETYSVSEQYKIDLEIANDKTRDLGERRDAQSAIQAGLKPGPVHIPDFGAAFLAVFVHTLVMATATLRAAPRLRPGEAQRIAEAEAAEARRQRRNEQARKRRKTAKQGKPGPNVFNLFPRKAKA